MRIKFFLEEYISPEESEYSTEAIVLAQGLRKLGIQFFSNVPNWRDPIEQAYLFQPAPEGFEADVNIYFSMSYFLGKPERLATIDTSKINIALERNDELVPYWQRPDYEGFSKFDLILISHYNDNQPYPPYKVKPWQMGYTERIYNYIEKYIDEPVEDIVLDTYRLHHNLRQLAVAKLSTGLKEIYPTKQYITDPLTAKGIDLNEPDLTYWKLTGKRHNPDYFRELNRSLFTYCFGGFFHPLPATQSFLSKLLRQYYKVRIKLEERLGKDTSSNYYIYQWDSYRLWEALLAKTCPILLDLEDWGFQLPVNPVNGKHYIGVHKFNFDDTIALVKSMSKDQIIEIGWEGRKWVMENYSPPATAKRFLKLVDEVPKKS
ncbi:MAG: hypothetical protein SFW35_11485 [Chitinophagales bacterium]|nr:hypothetical protein [Chitinophagales bacterium]